ncbi:MAG: type IV toxin-antitoxin system AbiEi family antitoxin [Planctomycetota bacterium]
MERDDRGIDGDDDLRDLADALAELPFVREVRTDPAPGDRAGRRLLLETTGGTFRLMVEQRRGRLGLDAAAASGRHLAADADALLLTLPPTGPEVRAELRRQGVGYLDAAGNCFLSLDGGRLTAHLEGAARPLRHDGRRDGRRDGPGDDRGGGASASASAGRVRAAGYRVLFALLARPELAARTVRDVAAASGASRSAVSSMLARMRDEGTLVPSGRSGHVWQPDRRRQLLARFATGWSDVLAPHLRIGRFRLRDPDLERAERQVATVLATQDWGFGGGAAAMRLAPYHRGADLVIHTRRWSAAWLRDLEAAPDKDGPLVVYRAMGELDLTAAPPQTAHPLLVFAELSRQRDPRARDAAEHLRVEVLDAMLADPAGA